MKGHEFILMLFLTLAAIIALVFIFVYQSSLRTSNDQGVNNPTKKRFIFAILLSACLLILLSVTVPKSPYFKFTKDNPSVVVYATARQYVFDLSTKPIDDKNPSDGSEIELPVNKVIEFRVRGIDVNHGFVIYNDKTEIVAQTQAMPGYVNRLRWKFDKAGTYHVLCLEFCGAGHAYMRTSFTVK